MPSLLARALHALSILSTFLCISIVCARAELVWTPQTGWQIEGGALSGLAGTDARNALALMNKARAAEEKGHRHSAISSYNKVFRKYPSSIYSAEALFRAGKLYHARKQYAKAFESLQQILARYPNTTRFNDVIGEEYRIASALLDGAHPRYWGWLPGFRSREKGIVIFEYILANAPYSDYAPLALMNIARGHQKLRDTEEAIDSLDRMINTYPQSLLAPDAYLQLAKSHAALVDGPAYDQTSTKDAATYFEDFIILFPNDPGVSTAAKGMSDMKTVLAQSKIMIGDFYFYKRSNYTAAKVFYNEAITDYPDSVVAAKAKKRLADIDADIEKHKPKFGPDGKIIPPKRKRFYFF
ncbi:MAG: outer membrane protein assembly factor BamD [Opitutaceae bacterium]|jgi:outer membrane protein assembly factor BamD